MTIIVDTLGFPCATFRDAVEGQNFYDGLPPNLKEKYRVVEQQLEYPYYYLWTWDREKPWRPREEHKKTWKVEIGDAAFIDSTLKSFKRDREWEKRAEAADEDTQYAYLGMIYGDGYAYGLREELGMTKYGERLVYEIFDHEHLEWYMLERIKNMGVTRALIRWKEEVKLKKFQRRARKFKRLMELSRAKPLPPKAQKTLKRLVRYLKKHSPIQPCES
jgi:hypothetical protein